MHYWRNKPSPTDPDAHKNVIVQVMLNVPYMGFDQILLAKHSKTPSLNLSKQNTTTAEWLRTFREAAHNNRTILVMGWIFIANLIDY